MAINNNIIADPIYCFCYFELINSSLCNKRYVITCLRVNRELTALPFCT